MNLSKLKIASYLAMTQKKDFFVPREALVRHVIAKSPVHHVIAESRIAHL
jgi:hypothetical protein